MASKKERRGQGRAKGYMVMYERGAHPSAGTERATERAAVAKAKAAIFAASSGLKYAPAGGGGGAGGGGATEDEEAAPTRSPEEAVASICAELTKKVR